MEEKRNRSKSKSSVENIKKVIRVVKPIDLSVMAHQLESFTVTTDSVVATANLVFNSSHRLLTLHWGDDESDIINLRKLRQLSIENGPGQNPNTLKVQHVYKEPFQRGQKMVVAVTTDNVGQKAWDAVVIETDPRFKLNFYSTIMEFPEHLDSSFNSDATSELDVTLNAAQNGSVFFSKQWEESILTAPSIPSSEPITWRLEESHFSREISFSDEPIVISFFVDEHDGLGDPDSDLNAIWEVVSAPFRGIHGLGSIFPSDFDGSNLINGTTSQFEVHPSKPVYEIIEFNIGILGVEGKVYAHLNYELKLIVPLDKQRKNMMT